MDNRVVVYEVELNRLRVFEGNSPKRLKDVDNLSNSIARIGQIEPIVITRANLIVAGHRRWEAMKRLNAKTIRAIFVEDVSKVDPLEIYQEVNEQIRPQTRANHLYTWFTMGTGVSRHTTCDFQRMEDLVGRGVIEVMVTLGLSDRAFTVIRRVLRRANRMDLIQAGTLWCIKYNCVRIAMIANRNNMDDEIIKSIVEERPPHLSGIRGR